MICNIFLVHFFTVIKGTNVQFFCDKSSECILKFSEILMNWIFCYSRTEWDANYMVITCGNIHPFLCVNFLNINYSCMKFYLANLNKKGDKNLNGNDFLRRFFTYIIGTEYKPLLAIMAILTSLQQKTLQGPF